MERQTSRDKNMFQNATQKNYLKKKISNLDNYQEEIGCKLKMINSSVV